jgi:pimeloyl-ACP methyl ester carboxylesterase
MTLQRIPLSTGVELDIAISGDPASPPIILLHGFPESHRTWRDIAPDLARDHYVIAPDQRGFARSSKPEGVDSYTPDKIVADLIALADHLKIDRFTLVGHDWGGAVAWMAALRHPLVFQRTMFDDLEQRAASQYIRAFRNPDLEQHIESIGLETFFDTSFSKHADLAAMAEDKAAYLDEWGQPGAITGMLNWYRASAIVVPTMDETPPRPAFLDAPFPPTKMPVLVIWGMQDSALLPGQLDLAEYVPDLTIEKIDAGHFVPWQKPDAVIAAMRGWGI